MSRIIITGPTCSGKSSLRDRFVQRGFQPIVQFTTREIREGEENGKDYHFISEEDFKNSIENDTGILCYNTYENGTSYGITNIDWLKGHVAALGIKEVQQLPELAKAAAFIIYINPDVDVIRQRLEERGDSPEEAERRMESDVRDYDGFQDWDIIITDPNNFKI